uniref:Uncharacterized protein n=1 Tax=viral metagenome TaxID=1070528 RepID=A0A6C0B1C9_9ZZZZ
MSRYVPPKLRKELTVDEKLEESIKIVQEGSDKHFPSLGGNTPMIAKSIISYGAKAKEWEEKREAIELKERVDARMTEYKAEKARQEEEEYRAFHSHRMRRNAIVPEPTPRPTPVTVEVKPKAEDEWTTVQKKPRKPKKEVNLDEEPDFDNYEGLAEDQDTLWG